MSQLGLGCVKTQAPAVCVEYLGGIAVLPESNLAAYISLDAAPENSIFHTSLIYEFSHSQGQPLPSQDFCGTAALPG
jgi:hypothetical protein